MFLIKALLHFIVFTLLTVLTQIGGIVYLIVLFTVKQKITNHRIKRVGGFILLYSISTFFITPNLAPVFGREKIIENHLIEAHTFFTKLANRNYVRPQLNATLQKIAIGLDQKHKGIKLIYLDANFPFINKFPLLPHLSHNDGKKIDLSLIYQDSNGVLTNKKRSVSGYGVYENPKKREKNQSAICKKKGYWQYDFPKYLTLGSINSSIQFSKVGTRDLLLEVLAQNEIGKIFIEPHLKTRLNVNHSKIRFHGCQAVRHDDHIHIQLK